MVEGFILTSKAVSAEMCPGGGGGHFHIDGDGDGAAGQGMILRSSPLTQDI